MKKSVNLPGADGRSAHRVARLNLSTGTQKPVWVSVFILLLAPMLWAQSGPTVWVVPSLQRVGPDDAPGSTTVAQVYAAKGEYESFQIVVRAGATSALSNVNVAVSDLSGPGGLSIPKTNLSLFREHYVYIGTSSPNWNGSNRPLSPGWYPDGLIPFVDPATGAAPSSTATLKAAPFTVGASKNQPIWVDVLVPRTAAAGEYTGTYTVTSDQGSVTGQIRLTVWNFTLPLKPSLKSSFLYWTASSNAAIQELLRHKINPERTPTSSQRAMIDNYGLTMQETGYWSGADIGSCSMSAAPSVTALRSVAQAQQPDLTLYNYTADEIDKCTGLYPTMKQWGYNLHQAGIKNLVTMAPVPELMDDGSGTGRSAVDIWVMLPVVYDGHVNSVLAAQAKGDEAWSYNCLVQDAYSPKWMIDFAPINFRIQPGFLNQSLGLTGLLYWRIDLWSSDPWNNPYTSAFARYPGEGLFVYPGSTVGVQGVAPSIRLKWLRDGVEDYEYIELLKKAGQEAWAKSVAAGVGSSWSQWTKDANTLTNARMQLGIQLNTLGGGATAPGAPVNPSPATAATGVALTPTLSWATATQATSYDVYLGTTSSPAMAGTVTATNFTPGTLQANATYYWRVVAKNASGSTTSATWSFTTAVAAPGVPSSPSPATGSTGVPATPTLTWGAVSGATSYDVYLGTSASPGLAATVASASYSPGSLAANTVYYWRVVAKNASGSTMSATWSFTTAAATPSVPGVPGSPSPASGSTGVSTTPTLTWGAVSGATSYDVYAGTSSSPALAGNIATTSFNPGTLSAGTTYYWRVVAKNSSGSTSSAVWSFTTAANSSATLGAVSASPSAGSGTTRTFAFTYSVPKGLANANVLINTSASGQRACWFNYAAGSRTITLADDRAVSWSGAVVGSGTVLQNTQCSIAANSVSVLTTGSTVRLTVAIVFKSAFAGTHNLYLRVQDMAGTMTPFTKMGTWTVPR